MRNLQFTIKTSLFSLLLVFLLFTFYFLLSPTLTHAAACTDPTDWHCVIGGVNDPTGIPGNNGDEQLSNFMTRIIELIFIAAGIVFTFMIVFGAFQWITSGGEKEAISKARGRITHAIIGIVLLALSFLIINIIANITNIGILKPFSGPPPAVGVGSCSGDRTWNPVTRRCDSDRQIGTPTCSGDRTWNPNTNRCE